MKNKNNIRIKNSEIKNDFESRINGIDVKLYYLINNNDIQISITNYGSTIIEILVPDKITTYTNIVFHPKNLEELTTNNNQYYCSVFGQYANKISDEHINIDGIKYKILMPNNNYEFNIFPSTFNKVVWKEIEYKEYKKLTLEYITKEYEKSLPGIVKVRATYEFNDNNDLIISFTATTTQKTVIDLFQNMFINLNGLQGNSQSIDDHILFLNSKCYLPLDKNILPTGEIITVKNTKYDFFSKEKKISELYNDKNEKNKKIEFFSVLDKKNKNELIYAGKIRDMKSNREIEIKTTEPGIFIYNYKFYIKRQIFSKFYNYSYNGIGLITQHFPDSPNISYFPSVILNPGQTYETKTIYTFIMNK